nr:Mo-dependent nitrogenase C-terminal domain-containing protein [Kamptonema formosum]
MSSLPSYPVTSNTCTESILPRAIATYIQSVNKFYGFWVMYIYSNVSPQPPAIHNSIFDSLLQPMRDRIDRIEICDRNFAHTACKLIPSQCPFARDIQLFGRTLFHIPPMCKINPLYDQLMSLRFRALTYLADVCGEDITCYSNRQGG